MARFIHDNVIDAALNYIKNNADQISICSDTPTTYGTATTAGANRLAIKTELTSSDYTGPSDKVGGGRELAVAQHTAIAISDSGTATHIALTKSGTSELVFVTTCTSQVLSAGSTVTAPSWKIGFSDPS